MATKYKKTKKEIAFEERMKKQRAKRGFSDQDVWSIDCWFYEIIAPMLRQLANTSHGYFCLDKNGDFVDHENETELPEVYIKRWTDTLLHMAYLADEMNEEKCSMKNPYDKECNRVYRNFYKKYGFLGEKLQTEEDKKVSKEKGYYKMYTPGDDPIHGEEYKKILDLYFEYEPKIMEYREKCKNEFFTLFSKYFWNLGD